MTKDGNGANDILDELSAEQTVLLELLLNATRNESQQITAREREADELLPASVLQRQLWFVCLEGANSAYNICLAVRMRGDLDRAALRIALNLLIERHEALRTTFVDVAGEPYQRVGMAQSVDLEIIDLDGADPQSKQASIDRYKELEAHQPFDLQNGPLIRGRLLCVERDQHVLLLTIHHIAFDAWSMGILARELSALYSACVAGQPDPLPPLRIQYVDYSQWQREWLESDALEQQLSFWRAKLQSAPTELELPTDRPRPLVQSYRGDYISTQLAPELVGQLHAFMQRQGMTLFMALYAACAILLSRLSGQRDVVIGTPVASRSCEEFRDLIGLFVNTLVLRIDVADDLTIAQFLQRAREVTLDAYDRPDVPFESLVQALQPHRTADRNPLFQVILVVQNLRESAIDLPGITVTAEEPIRPTAKFDLLLFVDDQGEGIRLSANYAVDLFDRQTVARWLDCLVTLLKQLVSGDHDSIGDLAIMPSDQIEAIRAYNATTLPWPQHRLVHELFEEQARHTPKATAIAYGDVALSYEELDASSSRLAEHLRRHGIGPDGLVGICMDRSPAMIVGLLGIMKAGGAYIPLDPSYPSDRLRYMLADADPSIVLTEGTLQPMVSSLTHQAVVSLGVDLSDLPTPGSEAAADNRELSSADLVYVIYTSGSTGRPKGTAMRHSSMVNLIEWHRRNLECVSGCRVLQFAALSFDVAFQEIFTTLGTGGTLVLLDDWVRRDVVALAELLDSQSVHRLFIPPVALQSLAEHACASGRLPVHLRDVITAGEQLRITPDIIRLFEQLPGCRLHNHYGPTETHVVTALTLSGPPASWPALPSIGRPIGNTKIHILDERRRIVPPGVVGEIYIGGAALARGYLGRDDLTAQRFVPDSVDPTPSARIYKTGDLGRWQNDGTIAYLGRNDDQVKIRGYRIEAGEIESQLVRHPSVKQAAVVAREHPGGDKRLVAYVTAVHGNTISVEALRAHLGSTLPEHMIPSAFVVMERIPLTPSGKLDRRALPTPEADAYVSVHFAAPVGEVEQGIAEIWQRLLHVDQIGRHDNFFGLGGHSLMAVKALFQINQRYGKSLRVTDLYRNPTIHELAARVSGGLAADIPVELAREASLDPEIRGLPGLAVSPAKTVLLTGATGFLGRFLLAQLLEDSEATVYCLVRARNQPEAAQRLRNTLQKWDLWRADRAHRIVAIPGDLCRARLGIDDATYETLARTTDSILHCATSMNHLETYAMAKAANVDAVRDLLRLATCDRPMVVNLISTTGVFGGRSGRDGQIDEYTSIDDEPHFASTGYVTSKWVSEKMLMNAAERGVPCNIFRVGLVWPDTQQGRYDELQQDYRVLVSCLMTGYGIRNYRDYAMPTPVDYAARAIVYLAGKHSNGHGRFHISSTSRRVRDIFDRANEIAGTRLELMSYYDWIRQVKLLHEQGWQLPAVPLIEYAFSMDEQSFTARQSALRASASQVACARTQNELTQAGIHAPELDDRLLRLTLTNLLGKDARLHAPPASEAVPMRMAAD